MTAPLVIPPEVEAKFEPKHEPKIERSANVVQLARGVSRWRRMTVVMGAIAALLALYIGLAQFAPGLVPLGPRTQVVAQAPGPAQLGARLVAVLQQEPTAPAFLLTVDPQSRTLVVRRVSATPEAGRSYELWLISSRGSLPAPKSLGVVGNDEFTQRPIPGNRLILRDLAGGELHGVWLRALGRLAERRADRAGAVHRQDG